MGLIKFSSNFWANPGQIRYAKLKQLEDGRYYFRFDFNGIEVSGEEFFKTSGEAESWLEGKFGNPPLPGERPSGGKKKK